MYRTKKVTLICIFLKSAFYNKSSRSASCEGTKVHQRPCEFYPNWENNWGCVLCIWETMCEGVWVLC